ncbi:MULTISPECIES: Lrp/AsnC family transcriptional regulator [Kitasatospora]|uniref:Lrp/AsnC family transcriptional regulator n=1 Tax=Kitasatospora TaxID=2063 RepID=UPI0004C45EDF|nr:MULTISPECIES: Lrp/AsnC family transcriptional regulator [unclassified Kitasatospora]WAL72988.1 Lrp/AsnC family transcriptional regulator [Kitasatospora sp. YST-16]WNW39037.1 Lrp/AsnC family transcriptional regulator [Streptomyces sp. Li-HN-5-13]
MIDELDLALVDALRVDPRAPWSRLAAPLGVDPATLSRRWARLTANGDAWVTCYPSADRIGRGLTALVQVDCPADRVTGVAAALARHPQAASIELVTGDADLLLTVAAYDHAALTAYLLDRLGTVPGVLRTRTTLVERTVAEGSRFSNGALDAEQRRAIAAPPPGTARPVADRRVEEDLALIRALGADGRMPYAALAARTGLPATTVRRRLAELRDSGRAVLRCDASPRVTGHPVGAMLWLDVPPAALPDTARRLTALPQTRMCAVTVGPANLALYLVAPQLPDLRRIEQDLAQHHPAIRVHDRHVTLRTLKLVGHLLTPDGRRTDYVPIEP